MPRTIPGHTKCDVSAGGFVFVVWEDETAHQDDGEDRQSSQELHASSEHHRLGAGGGSIRD
eukprot:2687021-Rhodomonas_salina.4